jgi:DNA-directed RNA polymerase subunit RPC12/RpoP
MTSEVRTVVDIGDILGVEVECRNCKAKVSFPVEKSYERLLSQCPNCNENLFIITRDAGGKQGSVTLEQVTLLMRIIRFLTTPSADCGANVRLYLDSRIKGHSNLCPSEVG